MKNRYISLIMGLLFLVNFAFAGENQYQFEKVLYNFDKEQSNGYGIHGVAVDAAGMVWIATFGNVANDTTFTAGGDTLINRPIYVLDPATGNHASFSPIRVLEMPDGSKDSLNAAMGSGSRGISTGYQGNILYTFYDEVYEIDHTTGKVIQKLVAPKAASLTEAAQDDNGYIYLGHVGKGNPYYIYDKDFNFIGNAIDTVNYINRSIAISGDGKDLFTGSTWNGFGVVKYHSDIPGITQFVPVDTFGTWDSVVVDNGSGQDTTFHNVKMWASCLDFGPDKKTLFAGNLRDDWSSGGAKTGSKFYAINSETGEIEYSVGAGYPTAADQEGFYSPRGAAWSPDGKTVYFADFDYNMISVWTAKPNSIVENGEVVARSFNLGNNYPNPFNPTTVIPFELKKNANVTLNVYNVNGQLVETLINGEMTTGKHEHTYNATNLSSGVYYYQLNINGHVLTKSMILVK